MAKWYFGTPNARQDAVLRLRSRYVAYGGARGGGKSWLVRQKAVLEALTVEEMEGLLRLLRRGEQPPAQGESGSFDAERFARLREGR